MQSNITPLFRSSLLGLCTLAGAASAQVGQVYTLTNAAAGNEVMVYDRDASGALTFDQAVPTGGLGTDAGLGNQGAVILSQDERFLLAVNAGSDSVSVFRIDASGLVLVDVEPARGVTPVSLTQHDDFVFVLNAGSDSIAGFGFDFDGNLTPVAGSLARLSGQGTAPAQIQFGPRGRYAYVTEKATSNLLRFRITPGGVVQSRVIMASPSPTPFGFAIGLRGQLFVSEAQMGNAGASTLSSYTQEAGGTLGTVSSSVASTQTAACWVVGTPDAMRMYTSNTADDSISSFEVAMDGSLTLLDAQAGLTGDGPLDMAITRDSLQLYVLTRETGAAGSLGQFSIQPDGSLTAILGGSQPVLPAGASGIAVR